MHRVLKLVYRYRQLTGKCATGAGLDFDEIGELTAIEATFAGEGKRRPGDRRLGERDFVRASVELGATLHRRQFRDPVTILDLAPGGFVCEGAPFLQEADRVEVVIGAGDDEDTSYRFIAEVAWTEDRDADCLIGFRFLGVPLEIRRLAGGAHAAPAAPHQAAAAEPPAPAAAAPAATTPAAQPVSESQLHAA
jgi:hypothetical protein